MAAFKSIFGRMLGINPTYGNLTVKGGDIDLTPKCVDASITVGAEADNVRAITIQLKDQYGKDIDYEETCTLYVLNGNGSRAAATGGSTGIAAGTDGKANVVVAKLMFHLWSESDGDIDLTWTDTGSESVILSLVLPNGRRIETAAFANT
jgi:hypothetical protein